jgi:hypothetical protein
MLATSALGVISRAIVLVEDNPGLAPAPRSPHGCPGPSKTGLRVRLRPGLSTVVGRLWR